MTRILNTNNVAVYGGNSETLAIIRELKKLGLIKASKSKSKSKPKMIEDIKQDSDMVASVKPTPTNQFPLRVIDSNMTQQQITDAQRKNEVAFAALRGEVQQQRLEDIERQQGQRFADFSTFFGIDNPALSRFRGAQQPGAGQRPNPFVQSTTIEDIEPDVEEREFKQSLNEGGPDFERKNITQVFKEDEESELPEGEAFAEIESETPIPVGGLPLRPQEKIGGGVPRSGQVRSKRVIVAADFGLDAPPLIRTGSTRPQIEEYYRMLADRTQNPINSKILSNKEKMVDAIHKILDEYELPQ